jgi:hypothetical protein
VFCQNCGATFPAGNAFCTSCGAQGGRPVPPVSTTWGAGAPLGEIARAWRFGTLGGPTRVLFRPHSVLFVWVVPPRPAGRAQHESRRWMREWLDRAPPGPVFLRPPQIVVPNAGMVEAEFTYATLLRVHVNQADHDGGDPRVVACNLVYHDARDRPHEYRLWVFAILGDRAEARRFLAEMPVKLLLDRPLPAGFKPAHGVL